MAIIINHSTKVISIPKADTTFLGTNATTGYEVRSYDEYALMRELADYLDSEAGASLPNAFTHSTNVTISGVVFARLVSFLAPYTVTFENGAYQVKLVGGTNNNMLDVLNPNNVSVIPANSAGLQQVSSGSGLDAGQDATLTAINAAVQAYLDATVSSRLPTASYTTPPTASQVSTQVLADAVTTPIHSNTKLIDDQPPPFDSGTGATPTQIADAVRTELTPELANIDAPISKTLTTTKFLGLQ